MKTVEKKFIVLKGLEGNPPTGLTPFQGFLKPYVPEILTLWWAVWIITLGFLVFRYIIRPIVKKGHAE